MSAAPDPTTTTTSVPLGRSAVPSEPPLTYTITCVEPTQTQTFQGTLDADGELTYPNVPAGSKCSAMPNAVPDLSDVSTQQFPAVTPAGISTIVYKEGIPAIILSPAVGPPGRSTTVLGAGFPPNDHVTLTWSPGLGAPLVVDTDSSGDLDAQMLVLPQDNVGLRQLVVTGSRFPSIHAGSLVVDPTVEASGPSTQVAFRS